MAFNLPWTDLSLVCRPLRTLDELLNFHKNPIQWKTLVEERKTRTGPYKYTEFKSDPNELPIRVGNSSGKRKILVCHDFKGNYREDSYISEADKWDGYRFYNWYGIDIFCYFSHDLVSVPTLQYINAAHKHGVQVLGTFIVEFSKGALIIDSILESREKMEEVADSLAFVANFCGFDGWLLNIESPVKKEKVGLLVEFVEYLTHRVHQQNSQGLVIWYDSVTIDGALAWQNEVNSKNKIYLEKCDGIFLNYNWSDQHLERTLSNIDSSPPENVFVGIDVFGRGQTAKLETHKTFERIPGQLSVALFATGWTLESIEVEMKLEHKSFLSTELNSRFLSRDRQFWSVLWPLLDIHAPFSHKNGKKSFYSSFCMGSGEFANRLGKRVKRKPWFDLRKQELQPCNPSIKRYFEDSFDGGSCLKFEKCHGNEKIDRLFFCHITGNTFPVSYAFKRNYRTIDLSIVLKFDNGTVLFLVDQSSNDPDKKLVNRALSSEEYSKNIGLFEQEHRRLPNVASINGWEIRHHLCKPMEYERNRDSKCNLVDIGVKISCDSEIEEDAFVLLGALSVQELLEA